jgi:hypothetical protein
VAQNAPPFNVPGSLNDVANLFVVELGVDAVHRDVHVALRRGVGMVVVVKEREEGELYSEAES